MAINSEFVIRDAYQYDHRSAVRWLLSHAWRYRFLALAILGAHIASLTAYSSAPVLIGRAADEIVNPTGEGTLLRIALGVLTVLMVDALALLAALALLEIMARRVEADTREELYANLLGKSQTFHDRQRVGDLMARATDDIGNVGTMIMPGMTRAIEGGLMTFMPLIYMATIRIELLLVPLLFLASYFVALRGYTPRLEPVVREQREQFGRMNGSLEETVSGIELVKASARESFERLKFRANAGRYRDLFVAQGAVEARYLPFLLYGIALALTFLHAMVLYGRGRITLGEIIAFMGLMVLLRFPTSMAFSAISRIQIGIASAGRILGIIREETELDENRAGHSAAIEGEICFEGVGFGHGEKALLQEVSFTVAPGQTVAIVGQTGSGKTTLTQLVNRSYDASEGRILVDGVDVRDWNLTALRSQISKIEQDIFLFSRSIAENIAFGAPGATREQIEEAARQAQAHDFIMSLAGGYETIVGERGTTLSGGQRQRVALARAFLSDPRILILDDSTSAIDSATEDEIQKAIGRARTGRTTLLITHRLSQIRWADLILVLDGGRVVAAGTHDELLRSSAHYRRIFARYGIELPEEEDAPARVA